MLYPFAFPECEEFVFACGETSAGFSDGVFSSELGEQLEFFSTSPELGLYQAFGIGSIISHYLVFAKMKTAAESKVKEFEKASRLIYIIQFF